MKHTPMHRPTCVKDRFICPSKNDGNRIGSLARFVPSSRAPSGAPGSPATQRAAYARALMDIVLPRQNGSLPCSVKELAPYAQSPSPRVGRHARVRYPPTVAADLRVDMPEVADNFYLQPLAWSSRDQIAVLTGESVYLKPNASVSATFSTGAHPSKLVEFASADGSIPAQDSPASVGFDASGSVLAVGTTSGRLLVCDPDTNARLLEINTIPGGYAIGSIVWWDLVVICGTQGDGIMLYDLRCPAVAPVTPTTDPQLVSWVSGLCWDRETHTLATGSNADCVGLWDVRALHTPKCVYQEHKAAVRALAWHPTKRGLLASGGGARDRTVRIWSQDGAECITQKIIEVAHGVSVVRWSPAGTELLLAASGDLQLRGYPDTHLMARLNDHSQRIMEAVVSPNGTTLASLSADETMAFWRLAAESKSDSNATCNGQTAWDRYDDPVPTRFSMPLLR